VPDEVTFQTKPQLAIKMWQRARDASIRFPWVTADEVYGRDPALRHRLESQRQAYGLVIPCDHPLKLGLGMVPRPVATIAAAWKPTMWQRLSCGEGSKGPRLYDWAYLPYGSVELDGWQHWLLVRRSIEDPKDLAYYLVFGPEGTTLDEMVRIAGARWTVEESFAMGKGEVGLDQYEVRSWHGWYRHITLAMWALAFLVVTRAQIHAADATAGETIHIPPLLTLPTPDVPEEGPPPKKHPSPRTWADFLQHRGLRIHSRRASSR
jgi:SRSO17 transposase